MLSLDLRIPPAIERELVSLIASNGSASNGRSDWLFAENFSNEDHNNAARCMELSQAQWMSIVTWGNGDGDLKTWQLGLATTLASYAAQGWTKSAVTEAGQAWRSHH